METRVEEVVVGRGGLGGAPASPGRGDEGNPSLSAAAWAGGGGAGRPASRWTRGPGGAWVARGPATSAIGGATGAKQGMGASMAMSMSGAPGSGRGRVGGGSGATMVGGGMAATGGVRGSGSTPTAPAGSSRFADDVEMAKKRVALLMEVQRGMKGGGGGGKGGGGGGGGLWAQKELEAAASYEEKNAKVFFILGFFTVIGWLGAIWYYDSFSKKAQNYAKWSIVLFSTCCVALIVLLSVFLGIGYNRT